MEKLLNPWIIFLQMVKKPTQRVGKLNTTFGILRELPIKLRGWSCYQSPCCLYNSQRHNGRNCDEVQFKTKLLPDPAECIAKAYCSLVKDFNSVFDVVLFSMKMQSFFHIMLYNFK